MRPTRLASLALAAAALALPAAASSYRLGSIQADHPWIPTPPPGAPTAAGYVVLKNLGKGPDQLLGAATPAARALTLHRSMQSGGISRMTSLKAVALPPGGGVTFAPGGYHLMLSGLTAPLKAGQRVPVTLRFEKAGPLKLDFIVEAPGGGSAPPMDMPGMHMNH